MIDLKGRSSRFEDYVLVWDKQIGLFYSTSELLFSYRVGKGSRENYTTQSMLQALLTKKFIKRTAKNGKDFIMVSKSDLKKV